MTTEKCVDCGREVYVVSDPHGQRVVLDADASVWGILMDCSNEATATRTNAFVEHDEICGAPISAESKVRETHG